MQYEDTIEIRGVTVLRQADVALLCRIGNQHRSIPPIQFQPGRQGLVPSKGSMTDLLEVGTGDRVTFPDVLMAEGTALTDLLNEHVAVPPFLAPVGEHRRVVPSAPRRDRHPQAARHEPRAGVIAMDRYSPLRESERMISLRGSRLLLLAILVGPLVMVGYVAVLLFLPLLGLRRIFRRRATRAVVRWDSDAPHHSGVGTSGAR